MCSVDANKLALCNVIFWIITFICSVVLSFYYIYEIWYKWSESPIIVSFDENHISIDTVPFPSLTICSQIRFKQSEFNYTEAITKDSSMNDSYIKEVSEALSMICLRQQKSEFMSRENLNATAVHHLLRLALNKSDIVFKTHTYWSDLYTSTNLFNKVLTKDGVCYNINGLASHEILREDQVQDDYKYIFTNTSSKDWDINEGYLNDNPAPYPLRGRDSIGVPDVSSALFVNETEQDDMCNGLYRGYKIYIHHPADFPQASIYFSAALPNQLTSLALQFRSVTTSERLRGYPLKTRQCYFENDKYLRYFRLYTLDNCKIECLSNYTYKECGCVPFYMPHHNSYEICSALGSACAGSAEINLALNKTLLNDCACLPSCNTIQYDAEVRKTDYDFQNYLSTLTYFFPGDKEFAEIISTYATQTTYTAVEIYFKQPMFASIKRTELFGLVDFLGTCGGLLGLFLGFSCLSIVEIFYFLTFRVCKNINLDLKQEREATKDKKEPIP